MQISELQLVDCTHAVLKVLLLLLPPTVEKKGIGKVSLAEAENQLFQFVKVCLLYVYTKGRDA